MTRKTKRSILLSILFIALIGAGIGYYLWNKPHKDVRHASAIDVTAVTLYNTFSTDSIKARSSYTDKVLSITGTVTTVTVNQQQQQVILLQTGIADAAINCTMEENSTTVKPGHSITIKGICSGYIAGDAAMDLPGDVFIIRGYQIK